MHELIDNRNLVFFLALYFRPGNVHKIQLEPHPQSELTFRDPKG